MTEPTFDHERLDVYRLAIDYVAFSYGIAKTLTGIHRHARDQWLLAAQSIPLVALTSFNADAVHLTNAPRVGDSIEYAYRFAEYEYGNTVPFR